ncbi:TELO2-interacting protein 2 [Merluccius polli]|uniref:TELO2-interacting protein 2 n=1 Tax=Merluccius polli TaxID=89951 RepID=A0AA47MVP9_MERPO|nr:TELO2-interacting protein 2 [Merluccius polli]
MDLSLLLGRLHLSSSAHPSHLHDDGQPFPPITEVLSQLQDKLSGVKRDNCDSEIAAAIGQAEQLFKIADSLWLFSPDDTGQTNDSPACDRQAVLVKAYVGVVQSLTCCASLPACEVDSHLPDGLYRDVPARSVLVCSALCSLLSRLGPAEGEVGGPGQDVRAAAPHTGRGATALLLAAVAPLCCVFAVTHFQEQLWTDAWSRESAGCLLSSLLTTGGWRDVPHLLMGDEESPGVGKSRALFEKLLDVLQPNLTKDLLHQSAVVKLVFSWALLQMRRPSLSNHLPRVIPPSLLLSDHYRPENCILGIRCLHHIVLQTSAAELRQYNRAEVIYQALYKHLYTTNGPQIQLVLDCLLDLLLVLEKPPCVASPQEVPRRPCRHDDVMRLLLTNMEMEHKVALRRVYAAALPKYIHRHLQRVERVLMGYLEVSDPPQESSRGSTLDALETLLPVAWPRIEHRRVDVFLRCLLRLLVDVTSDRLLCTSVKEKLTNQTSRCLTLLNHCSNGRVQSLLQLVDSSCASAPVLRCLETVTMVTAARPGPHGCSLDMRTPVPVTTAVTVSPSTSPH